MDTPRFALDPRRFALTLAGLPLVAFARGGVSARAADGPNGFSDALWFHEAANGTASGRGYPTPSTPLGGGKPVCGNLGEPLPPASPPPLFPALLAVFSLV